MPIYEYRCDRGHTFEVMQRMSEDPLQSCSTCDAPVQRVFKPVAVHCKGSGFYTTDYGRKKTESGGSTDSSGGDSKGGDSKAGDSKGGDSGSKASKESSSASSGGGSSKSD